MPPKVKITKDEIVTTALTLVRQAGVSALNARNIASALGCSTQPVFSNFASMEELQQAVLRAAYDCYAGFIQNELESGKYPAYKAMGMAYIRFAQSEKELFRLLFMCDRQNADLIPTPDFDESVKIIMKANGISEQAATLMHLEMWTFVHGIGTMMATSFLALDWELVSQMLSDIYQGLQKKHTEKER